MPGHYAGWRAALAQQGMELDEKSFFENGGTPSRILIPRLASHAGIEIDFPRALDAKETHFLSSIDTLTAIDPIVEIARQHRGRLPMAVASGGTRRLVELQLKQIKVFEWFDSIVASEDTERGKPDPDVFLEAAKRIGVAPEYCQVYEDGEPGIEAARRAGMACIDIRELV